LGNSLAVFIGVTLILFGGASFMMGQALAATWRPAWQNAMYGLLLGFSDRLVCFLLFGGELLSLSAYSIDTAILIVIAFTAYRLTRAQKMVAQYPWLYERTSPFTWRERPQ
jgi:hypothetical protein